MGVLEFFEKGKDGLDRRIEALTTGSEGPRGRVEAVVVLGGALIGGVAAAGVVAVAVGAVASPPVAIAAAAAAFATGALAVVNWFAPETEASAEPEPQMQPAS